MRCRRSAVFFACLGVLALAGFSSVLLITSRFGPGLSPDSAYYLSAARSFAAGRGIVTFEGEPMVSWPPLFSVLLATGSIFGADPLPFARFLNAATFGTAILLGGFLLARALRSLTVAVAAAFGIAVSPLLPVSLRVWSEPVFAVLTLVLAVCLARFLRSGARAALAACCIVSALTCLQRYIGVAFILPVFALISFFPATIPWQRRLRRAGLFVSCALTPLCVWVARNYVLTQTLTGLGLGRSVNLTAFLSNFVALFSGVAEVLLPVIPTASGLWVLFPVLLAAAAFSSVRDVVREPEARSVVLLTGTGLTLGYLLSLALLLTPDYHDSISRLLTPIAPLLLLVVVVCLERGAIRLLRRYPKRAVSLVVFVIVIVGFSLRLVHLIPACRDWYDNGNGVYDGVEWRNSRLLDWLRANPLEGSLYSNDPAAIYLLTGMSARMSPRRTQDPSASGIRPGDKLVWFRRVNRPYLYTVEELCQFFVLEEIAFVGEGGVLEFR